MVGFLDRSLTENIGLKSVCQKCVCLLMNVFADIAIKKYFFNPILSNVRAGPVRATQVALGRGWRVANPVPPSLFSHLSGSPLSFNRLQFLARSVSVSPTRVGALAYSESTALAARAEASAGGCGATFAVSLMLPTASLVATAPGPDARHGMGGWNVKKSEQGARAGRSLERPRSVPPFGSKRSDPDDLPAPFPQ